MKFIIIPKEVYDSVQKKYMIPYLKKRGVN